MERSFIGMLQETQEYGIASSYIRSDIPPQPETARWNTALASTGSVLAEASETKAENV